MSGKGNCCDNSAPLGRFALPIACRAGVESFFKSLKAELANPPRSRDRPFQYINGFCSPRRKHPALGWKSPVAFEQWVAQDQHLTGTKPVQAELIWQQKQAKRSKELFVELVEELAPGVKLPPSQSVKLR